MKPPMITQQRKAERNRGLLLLIVYLSLIPMSAHAGVAQMINNFLTYLTGDVGKALASVAIVGGGIACFGMGKLPKQYFIAILIGVVIVFGGHEILNQITGS